MYSLLIIEDTCKDFNSPMSKYNNLSKSRPFIEHRTPRNNACSPCLQVLVFLRFLASGIKIFYESSEFAYRLIEYHKPMIKFSIHLVQHQSILSFG